MSERLSDSNRIVGVDIGSHGALALLPSAGELVEVLEMPTLDVVERDAELRKGRAH